MPTLTLDTNKNKDEVFFEAPLFFAHLMEHISNARDSIELETYIFDNDELGLQISRCLKDAARRGVDVRVMVDGYGSPHWVRNFLTDFLKANIKVRIFNPLPFSALSPYFEKYPSLIKFYARLTTMNERNHRKVCIIDHAQAWTGGMNISIAHSHWRDTGVHIKGERVQSLLYAFQLAWQKSWGPDTDRPSEKKWIKFSKWISINLIRLNWNRKTRHKAYRELLEKIYFAQKRILITNAYFVPPQRILRALRAVSRNGVDVRVLVPQNPDVFFIHWVSSALYCGLLTANVSIYEYMPAPLHAKTLVIDDWATIGTTNLNHRSIIHDLEVDVVLTSADSIQTLVKKFDEDLMNSKRISIRDLESIPWIEKLMGRVLLWFRYWI